MFITALFTVAKTWKQPKCPSIDDWTKKVWYVYTMKYCSAIRKDEILQFATTWMDLKNIISNKSDKKSQPCDFIHMWDIKLKATNEQTRKKTQELTDTDNSMEVTRKKVGEGEERVKARNTW